MNILYLAHRLPFPPNKGDKIRSFHQIKYLSRNHRILLAAFVDDPADLSQVEPLRKYCDRVETVFLDRRVSRVRCMASLPRREPLSLGFYRSGKMSSLVDSMLKEERIDLAFMFSSVMAQYVRPRVRIRKIMDFVDVDSDKWRQYASRSRFPMSALYRIEAERLQAYEAQVARDVDLSLFVTRPECDFFHRENPDARVAVLRNGIDQSYFHRSCAYLDRQDPQRILFVGAMDYFPNADAAIHFAEDILPRIRVRFPDVVFDIVGRNPPDPVRVLGERIPGIRVTGEVPDVRPFLEKATLSVAPLRIARGVQNKVLEAMAMGVPVVASGEAFEGIDAVPGTDLLVAGSPEDFALKVESLLECGSRRQELSRNGMRNIDLKYGWDAAMRECEGYISSLGS